MLYTRGAVVITTLSRLSKRDDYWLRMIHILLVCRVGTICLYDGGCPQYSQFKDD